MAIVKADMVTGQPLKTHRLGHHENELTQVGSAGTERSEARVMIACWNSNQSLWGCPGRLETLLVIIYHDVRD